VVLRALSGHWWTLRPFLSGRIVPPEPPASQAYVHTVMDEQVGEVRLTGRISTSRSRTLVLLVHGLGGSAESAYLLRMARTVAAVGWSTLRLNLRGADLKGEDYYHAGLTSDLQSVLASSEVSGS